jgi:hypothetical protein
MRNFTITVITYYSDVVRLRFKEKMDGMVEN